MDRDERVQKLSTLALKSDALRSEMADRALWVAKILHPIHTMKLLAQSLGDDDVAWRIVKGRAGFPDLAKLGRVYGWAVREFIFGDSFDVELKAIARSRDTHEIADQIDLSQRNLEAARFALGLGPVERSGARLPPSRGEVREGFLQDDEIAARLLAWPGGEE